MRRNQNIVEKKGSGRSREGSLAGGVDSERRPVANNDLSRRGRRGVCGEYTGVGRHVRSRTGIEEPVPAAGLRRLSRRTLKSVEEGD
jgi:hypothetical protein